MITFIRESSHSVPKGAPAICAPHEDPTSYEALLDQVDLASTFLTGLGLGRGDKIAIVLPEGPCAATAFLGVAQVAVAAPLNPRYRKPEFEHFLSRLGAKALIVEAGSASPAVDVARERKMAILELAPNRMGAGLFTLRSLQGVGAGDFRASDPETCLALFTSGTTGRPKVVPLTRANLCLSARNVARTLKLSSEDRCLNVMPLFHMHGLVSTIMATIASGGSVVCAPGPKFPDFFEWLREFRPTWYTAAPTIHQAILSNARLSSWDPGSVRSLRLVRSASAPLAPSVMAELGRLFQVPVIENYGMTEASQQIASNPLPPAAQKPGSVGLPDGPEVAILGESDELIERGRTGEVVIRGPTVTSGYENDAEANRRAFVRGWFRTGDLGYFDADGYLFLVGRIGEIINRGGEKVSPREVDEAMLSHPDVLQAVAFPMPHPTLGQEVGAAVVLKPGQVLSEGELREFVGVRLAEFKVPKRVLFVDAIPQGQGQAMTGKIQRVGLCESLRERLATHSEGPRSVLEERIVAIWKEVLKRDEIGVHDDFFSLGGDSLQAMAVIALARKAGIFIDPARSFDEPTIAGLASIAQEQPPASAPASPPGFEEPWWKRIQKRL
jgi:oxalate---CoA ligase